MLSFKFKLQKCWIPFIIIIIIVINNNTKYRGSE